MLRQRRARHSTPVRHFQLDDIGAVYDKVDSRAGQLGVEDLRSDSVSADAMGGEGLDHNPSQDALRHKMRQATRDVYT